MKMRRVVLLLTSLALLAPSLPVAAQHGSGHEGTAGPGEWSPEMDAAAAANPHAGHQTELDHLGIHGIGDLFSIPEDLPAELREEREHLRNQLLAAFVNFGLLLAVLGWKVRPMVRQGLVDRRNTIAKDLEEASRLRSEAEAKHAEYKRRLAALDDELVLIREEMKKAGEAEGQRIVAEAQAKAERTRRETEFLIDQRMKSLKSELTRETVLSAVTAAEKLLVEKAGAEDQQRLSRAYVTQLAQTGGTAASKGGAS